MTPIKKLERLKKVVKAISETLDRKEEWVAHSDLQRVTSLHPNTRATDYFRGTLAVCLSVMDTPVVW